MFEKKEVTFQIKIRYRCVSNVHHYFFSLSLSPSLSPDTTPLRTSSEHACDEEKKKTADAS
jgi:hypothetical protein